MTRWPISEKFRRRYLVPDLSPEQRPQLVEMKPKIVFVAESPHRSEVESERLSERRPLCGNAGRDWWKMIGGLVAGDPSPDVALARLLELCRQGELAVMNAVQYPLDPKIAIHCGSGADPVEHLGFSKAAPASYKTRKASLEVRAAVHALHERLLHPSVAGAPVVSLGLDAKWFVDVALASDRWRHLETVPHPSAWWRRGGAFREKARGQLTRLLVGGGAERVVIHESHL